MKVKYSQNEVTVNSINTLKLVGHHPLGVELIAKREHHQRTGRVECFVGTSETRVEIEEFGMATLRAANDFEKRMEELERVNMIADKVGREIFDAIEGRNK